MVCFFEICIKITAARMKGISHQSGCMRQAVFQSPLNAAHKARVMPHPGQGRPIVDRIQQPVPVVAQAKRKAPSANHASAERSAFLKKRLSRFFLIRSFIQQAQKPEPKGD